MKPHINTILKKGAKLEVIKLDINDKSITDLIDETVKEQEKVLALKKIDWKKMRNTYITI